MQIRVQTEKDFFSVQNLTREAFWNLYQPGADQHYYLSKLRKSPQFIPSLSLVIEDHGQIIAHIAYSRTWIIQQESKFQVVTFGPLSVLPSHMGKGVGSLLVRQSMAKAKQQGFKAVIIQGYPQYYCRFGFVCSKKYGISNQQGKFFKAMQAVQLEEGYLKNKGGIYISDFSIIPEQAEQFDKKFIKKEKFVTRSQGVFAKMLQTYEGDEDPVDISYSHDRTRLQ